MAELTLTTTSTLNDGSITVTVYEDVGGDGSGANTDALGNAYDNSASVSLAGGTDETNTLTGFDGTTGNDYWLQVEYGALTTVTDATPTFDAYTLASNTTVTGPSVTLDGSAIQGAVITIIESDTGDHLGTDTTDTNGDWAIDVPQGSAVHCMCEYEDADGNRYRDYSKPFIAT